MSPHVKPEFAATEAEPLLAPCGPLEALVEDLKLRRVSHAVGVDGSRHPSDIPVLGAHDVAVAIHHS